MTSGNGVQIQGARSLIGAGALRAIEDLDRGAVSLDARKSPEFAQHMKDLDEAFPVVDPGVQPLGGRVLVQLRTAKKVSDGGIILTDYSQEVERDVQQVARLIAIGPLAFRDKKTLEPWPECMVDGKFVPWASVGDYVKVPKYGGDKHYMPIPGRPKEDRAAFVVLNEHEIISKITCNPLHIIAYL